VRVLGFDTATRDTVVALCDQPPGGGLSLQTRDHPQPGARPGHARALLELIAQLVEQGGGWETVDRIAVGVGPGTFTGLRIGIATAHGLARARSLELVGVSTLTSLALAACADGAAAQLPVLALIDARRGELFAAAWTAGANPVCAAPALAPAALAPERVGDWITTLAGAPVAVGDGAILCREMLERAGAIVPATDSPLHQVSASAHCELGAAAVVGEAAAVRPLYLRAPDAVPSALRGL
jgi:tRNA threonylcarbamoyladenosine biosynthesis protein TsaB